MDELGYRPSVAREIAVLRVLSHPGVARLVSAFRVGYTGAVYLVLEYAARGDLHTFLLNRAPAGLAFLPARFLLGEITAALCALHAVGFAFNDLKPENVLLTALGHVKLADFGACRAISARGRAILRRAASQVLRSGEWRTPEVEICVEQGDKGAGGVVEVVTMLDGGAEGGSLCYAEEGAKGEGVDSDGFDARVECTPAYMPPEGLLQLLFADMDLERAARSADPGLVVAPSMPHADAWALGCLALFVLTGRPPFFGEAPQVLATLTTITTTTLWFNFCCFLSSSI
jgi:serine/threonine protein kinase